jgi:hypothetical protein
LKLSSVFRIPSLADTGILSMSNARFILALLTT